MHGKVCVRMVRERLWFFLALHAQESHASARTQVSARTFLVRAHGKDAKLALQIIVDGVAPERTLWAKGLIRKVLHFPESMAAGDRKLRLHRRETNPPIVAHLRPHQLGRSLRARVGNDESKRAQGKSGKHPSPQRAPCHGAS